MPELSSPSWALKPKYDVVIIGSGYGGAIAASRLARARRAGDAAVSIALLERGNEIPTGEFPDQADRAFEQITLDTKAERGGAENGLYYFHSDPEITVVQGCGLGGTSLINANVSLEPDPRVFQDPAWPKALRGDAKRLAEGYAHARAMLRPQPYPDKVPHGPLLKYGALAAAAGAGANVYHPPINVNFVDGVNHVGIYQPSCNGCGDCVSGCNVGAKNTLTKNYLPDAKNHGAEIFCGVAVRSVAPRAGAWAVYYTPVGFDRELYSAPDLFVLADVVIVSAGSIGSTEILLRSKAAGLPTSDYVGRRFSGNGDVLGFSYNGAAEINGIGRGRDRIDPVAEPGPTITGALDLRDTANVADGMIIEEGALPSAMRSVLPAAFKLGGELAGIDKPVGLWARARAKVREVASVLSPDGAYRGSVANTETFLTMCHDDGEGTIVLEGDRPRIRWPKLARERIFALVAKQLEKLASALQGTYVPSPLFTKYFHFDLLTVHPLGGCVLADDASSGVVDDCGRVFSGTSGAAAHAGLYVMDGSVVPLPLGVNPLLTISALAERSARLLIEDRGWKLKDGPNGQRPVRFDGVRDQPRTVTLHFSERMTGYVTTADLDDYRAAEGIAKDRGHTATAVYTIVSPDLDAMRNDPDRTAKLTGTVHLPALAPEPMTIFDGVFNLFVNVNGDKTHKHMRYRGTLVSLDGKKYYLDGFKEVQDLPGNDPYTATTVLFTTVRAERADGPVAAKGIMKIGFDDILNLVRTMRAVDTKGRPSLLERAKFVELFFSDLLEVYGPMKKWGSFPLWSQLPLIGSPRPTPIRSQSVGRNDEQARV